MAGHRRAEATLFFERLCPAMTMERPSQLRHKKLSGARYTKARSRKRGGAAFVLIEALLVHSYSSALHAPHR
jgi:hypothetical protein